MSTDWNLTGSDRPVMYVSKADHDVVRRALLGLPLTTDELAIFEQIVNAAEAYQKHMAEEHSDEE